MPRTIKKQVICSSVSHRVFSNLLVVYYAGDDEGISGDELGLSNLRFACNHVTWHALQLLFWKFCQVLLDVQRSKLHAIETVDTDISQVN